MILIRLALVGFLGLPLGLPLRNTYSSSVGFCREELWGETAKVSALRPPFSRHLGRFMACGISGEIDALINERVAARKARDFVRADEIKTLLEEPPYFLEIIDKSYKQGGGSTWRRRNVDTTCHGILDKLKAMAADAASLQSPEQQQDFVHEVLTLLREDASKDQDCREMQGRKFIDAAFELALLGLGNASRELFDFLMDQQLSELRRWGPRVSVRTLDISRMVEKAAAAGIVRGHALYHLAAELVRAKRDAGQCDEEDGGDTAAELLENAGDFSLSSSRPKMFIWKHLSKQRKAGRQSEQADPEPSSSTTTTIQPSHLEHLGFADPSLPLVIDLGCGLGVSLLAIAAASKDNRMGLLSYNSEPSSGSSQQRYNFLGIELNAQSVRYTRGVSERWGLTDVLRVLCCDVEAGLDCLLGEGQESCPYPGPVHLVVCNFPTPFRLGNEFGSEDEGDSGGCEDGDHEDRDESEQVAEQVGNSQLPELSQFMLNAPIVSKIERLLRQGAGQFLIQSQVEDVAVWTRRLVETETNLEVPATPPSRHRSLPRATARHTHVDEEASGSWAEDCMEAELSERQRRVLRTRPGVERAAGPGWLSESPLPPCAASETEVLCAIEEKRVHRIIFKCGGLLTESK